MTGPGATEAAQDGPEHVEAPVVYDAILLASFGGPEGQDDGIPFLRNVTRGRGIPEEDAQYMIINGFCKGLFQELPFEFAMEASQLLNVSLEGTVG